MRILLIITVTITLPACIVVNVQAPLPGSTGADEDSSSGDASSFGPGSTGEGSTGAADSTGGSTGSDAGSSTSTGAAASTGDADTSSGPGSSTGETGQDSSTGDSSGGSSTGESLAPLGAPCDSGDTCESGLCSVLGTCAAACPCDLESACVADSCIVTGPDDEGALVAFNDSPAGNIDDSDLDVWRQTLPGPGSYAVKIKDVGVSAWILDSAGNILANPADSVDIGDFTEHSFIIADSDPVTVIIVAPDLAELTAYYFYTVKL